MSKHLGVTRDSWVLWFMVGGTVFGYLNAVGEAPTVWPWNEWMKFGMFLCGLFVATLQQSPLPSHAEVERNGKDGEP